ncbi:hypothetical protein CTI12_AA191320 [Artemisia annua]|uniref:Uncharacterized protein n=1 Tax=Artemisia annua TaxID=35608 RepID=A0A2U1P5S3_ARTAN|nr:hypothetical protein CTI12_AA191320 [Artemisia annua]
MSNLATVKAWLVVVSIGSVVALKDQGIAKWNGPLKTLHQHAKTKYKKTIDDRYARSFSVGSEMMVGKYRSKKTKVERMNKVMEINCFGPNRF